MSVYKIVMNTFVFICETGKSSSFSEAWKLFITAGKKLMSITLVAYIPDKGIIRAVENAVKRNSKFNNAKITGQVSSVFTNNIYYCSTDFLSQLLEFFLRKLFDVFRRMDFRK